MILNSNQIEELVKTKNIISPFIDHKVKGALSYGLEPYGYTIRLADEFIYFLDSKPIDPMNKNDINLSEVMKSKNYLLKPNNIILSRSLEYLKMPNDVTGIALTKSSYARIGIFANITAIDAGWEGYLTIEIANLGNNPVFICANQGIAQIHFFKGEKVQNLYEGKYQKLNKIRV